MAGREEQTVRSASKVTEQGVDRAEFTSTSLDFQASVLSITQDYLLGMRGQATEFTLHAGRQYSTAGKSLGPDADRHKHESQPYHSLAP